MKSIEDYNAEKQKDLLAGMPKFPRPNGIKCPKCSKEMVDVTDGNVKCMGCNYQTESK